MILLIIEQDHPDVTLLGIPIFAALTRIGPGLAGSASAATRRARSSRSAQAFSPLLPWRRDARETLRAERAQKRLAKQQPRRAGVGERGPVAGRRTGGRTTGPRAAFPETDRDPARESTRVSVSFGGLQALSTA